MNPGLVSGAAAYDAIAPVYDAQLEQNPVAGYMRARLHRHLARAFGPGDRVLDFTAGTGSDACFLAGRGARVIALDFSPAMLAEARRAAGHAGVEIEMHVLAAERLGELELRELDGAISTFGGLNTIQELPQIARDLSLSLKPRGRVILHALNKFCFWEWARGHGRERNQVREVLIGRTPVAHRLYSPREVEAIFAPQFVLRAAYALSVLAAPAPVRRFPRLAPALWLIDGLAGRIFASAGDFFVLDFEKRKGLP